MLRMAKCEPHLALTLDFSMTAAREVHEVHEAVLRVCEAFTADLSNARLLPPDLRRHRAIALKERIALCERELADLQDAAGRLVNACASERLD